MQLLIIAAVAWFIAQLVKFSIRAMNSTPDWRLFYQSGGMPSAHAATVVALAVSSLALYGYMSPIFGLATVFAAVVIYDSLGVRRSSGEQSIILNAVIKAVGDVKPVREVLGHTPKEVFVGSMLGIAVGAIATYQSWTGQASWLAQSPGDVESLVYLGVFAGLIFAGLVVRIWLSKLRQVDIVLQLKQLVWLTVITPGFVGIFTSLLQYQTRGGGGWRVWSLLVIAIIAVLQAVYYARVYRDAPRVYRDQAESLLERRKQARDKAKKEKKKKRRKKR